jgi:predicted N-acetyltransferase YhbS
MITIRAETAEDIPAVRRVNELAFGQPDEGDLVDALRATDNPVGCVNPSRVRAGPRQGI